MSASADAGESGEAFHTHAFPCASAGASFQAGMASGKFQGVMSPTTPARPPPGHEERAAVGRRIRLAVGIERGLGVVAKDRGGARDLAARLHDRLSHLAADERGERFGVGLDPGRGARQGIGARLARRTCPRRRGVRRRGDGAVDVDPAARREHPDHVCRVGGVRARDLDGRDGHGGGYLLT